MLRSPQRSIRVTKQSIMRHSPQTPSAGIARFGEDARPPAPRPPLVGTWLVRNWFFLPDFALMVWMAALIRGGSRTGKFLHEVRIVRGFLVHHPGRHNVDVSKVSFHRPLMRGLHGVKLLGR